jgi:hypothetical protein
MEEGIRCDILGYPGYDISCHGEVRTFWTKKSCRGLGSKTVLGNSPKVMKHFVGKDGRHAIMLYRDGVPKRFFVHTLVLEAFVGPRPEGKLGLHGPLGNGDNSVENLYWGTYSQNNGNDRYRDGTALVGEKLSWTKLTAEKVHEIRRLLSNGETPLYVASEFGVTRRLIYDIRNGRVWKWLK